MEQFWSRRPTTERPLSASAAIGPPPLMQHEFLQNRLRHKTGCGLGNEFAEDLRPAARPQSLVGKAMHTEELRKIDRQFEHVFRRIQLLAQGSGKRSQLSGVEAAPKKHRTIKCALHVVVHVVPRFNLPDSIIVYRRDSRLKFGRHPRRNRIATDRKSVV